MKKLFAIIFIAFFCLPVYGAKKNPAFDGMGYVGTLPDLTRQYQPTEPKSTKPVIEQVENFHSSDQVKPIPRDNPAFVNIILKQDKTTRYVNDINEFYSFNEYTGKGLNTPIYDAIYPVKKGSMIPAIEEINYNSKMSNAITFINSLDEETKKRLQEEIRKDALL